MKVIPILRTSNLARSLVFYTQVLDFTQTYPQETPDGWLIHLSNGDARIQLSPEGHFGVPLNFFLHSPAEIDALWAKYISRGLDPSHKPESPVHQSPLDQTWGSREFYVDDPDGNTLRFCAWHS